MCVLSQIDIATNIKLRRFWPKRSARTWTYYNVTVFINQASVSTTLCGALSIATRLPLYLVPYPYPSNSFALICTFCLLRHILHCSIFCGHRHNVYCSPDSFAIFAPFRFGLTASGALGHIAFQPTNIELREIHAPE